jgi:hypothetical protein
VAVTKFADARTAVSGFIRRRAVRVQKQEETPEQLIAEFAMAMAGASSAPMKKARLKRRPRPAVSVSIISFAWKSCQWRQAAKGSGASKQPAIQNCQFRDINPSPTDQLK